MESVMLNRLLIEKIPSLAEDYYNEVGWQEGDKTGSHTVYGDVLTPYIIKCIENKKDIELNVVFDFLELVLLKQDEYASEVIALSVLEGVQFILKEKNEYKNMMGNETKKLFEELLNAEEKAAEVQRESFKMIGEKHELC